MTMPRILPLVVLLALAMALASLAALAQEITPLRVSHVEGEVSFSRFGAEEWAEARPNIPLAPGDELYVGARGNLELQAGSRAFIRADHDTQLGLLNQTADFVQVRVASGRVSFDLRTLPSGHTVEISTPNAVFTIDRSGYYRVDVDGEVRFVTRRGGRAVVVPAGGQAMNVYPSEEVVVKGGSPARVETYVAPEPDRWDLWNYERTDSLLDAFSERYLPPGIAGAWDLDHYGRWRVVPEYGPVWVPDAVAYGWVPYSTGRWIWDPYYEWTWIDDAPWGWIPFHYGRWVHLGGYWAWAPGPAVSVAVYAPALVAFFDLGPSFSISIGFGTPGLAWVSLGWGEPLVPWWGRPGFIGRPWWGGWGGPRVVNNVVVRPTTIVNVTNITYVNSRVSNAVVATHRERFARGDWHQAHRRLTYSAQTGLPPVRGALPVKPEPKSLIADAPRRPKPPEAVLARPAVVKSKPPAPKLPWRSEAPARPVTQVPPERSFVTVPARPVQPPARPEFGGQTGPERERPPLPPRFEERQRPQPLPPQPGAERAGVGPSLSEPRIPQHQGQRTPQPVAPAVTRERERVEAPQAPRPGTPVPAAPRAMEPQQRQPAPPAVARERIETTQPQPRATVPVPAQPQRTVPEPRPAETQRAQPQAAPGRQKEHGELPGKPANRVYGVPARDRDGDEPRRPQEDR
jgi:hypothetical protein